MSTPARIPLNQAKQRQRRTEALVGERASLRADAEHIAEHIARRLARMTSFVQERSATGRGDLVEQTARMLLYLGLFFSSLLVLRLSTVTVGDALLIASMVFAAIWATRPGVTITPSPFPAWGTVVLVSMLLVGGSLSTFSAKLPADSLATVARLIILAILVPWLARVVLPSLHHVRVAAAWTAAGAAFAASGTLLQYVLGPHILPNTEVTQAGRFPGWTGHVSDLGGVAAMGIALCIGFVVTGRLATRVAGSAALLALCVGLILSGSVSGMLAAIVALLVYTVRRALKVRHVALILAVMLVVLYVASTVQANVVGALNPVDRLLQTVGITQQGRYSTTESRFDTTEAAFNHITTNPVVGVGLDPLSAIADGEFPVHNLLIGSWYQGGVLVLISILVLALRPLAGKWIRRDRSMLTTQLLAATAAAWMFAMTAPSLYNRYFWIPIVLLCVARALRQADAPAHIGGRA